MQNYVSTSKHPAPDVPCSPIEPIVVDNAKSSSEPPIKKNLKRKTAKSKQKIDEIVAPGSAPLTQCNDEDPIPKSLKLVTEKYYEFVDEEDTRPILSESANIVTSTQKSTEKSLSQSSLTSFFKKSQ
ncbi:hypothetical protein RF11_11203 [Thelohanellus kitauei]|uniref:Uncharacterized protein n=1 Tax=Thelohanellus kitauei TaxID=669202 RepID=A0A0C2INV1_THEKT|nr:hypothetical protein RF11_11203 [Thelohanellus kitauei]